MAINPGVSESKGVSPAASCKYLSYASDKASASKSTAIISLLRGECPRSLLTATAECFGLQRSMAEGDTLSRRPCAPNYRPRNALLCVKNNKFRLVTDREIDRSGDKTDVMDLLMNGRGGVEIGSW